MKEQGKNPPDQTNEEEIGSLPEKEYRVMIVKATQNLGNRMDKYRASLVAQWLRIRLPMQGTWVRALVQEDPTCHGATKPVRHNY